MFDTAQDSPQYNTICITAVVAAEVVQYEILSYRHVFLQPGATPLSTDSHVQQYESATFSGHIVGRFEKEGMIETLVHSRSRRKNFAVWWSFAEAG